MVAMLAMPRLPTPMAMLEPGARCAPNLELVSSREMVPEMSEIFLSGKCWRTVTRRGSVVVVTSSSVPLYFVPIAAKRRKIAAQGVSPG